VFFSQINEDNDDVQLHIFRHCTHYHSVSQTWVRGSLGIREALTGGPREIIVFL